MTEPPASASETTRHRVRRRRRPRQFLLAVQRIWQDWWVELLVVFLVLLAIFLLLERTNIRQTLFAWLKALLAGLERLISNFVQYVVGLVRGTTLSDLVAYLLLLIVAVLVVWRIRWRLMSSSRFTEIKCPSCGNDLHRIHRHTWDRVVNLFVPVRRYQCKNRDCRWRGLRVQTSRH
jgi:hypothetical protein